MIGEYQPALLPCPYCGSEATHWSGYDGNDNGPGEHWVAVGCKKCDDATFKTYVDQRTGADNYNASQNIQGWLYLESIWNKWM